MSDMLGGDVRELAEKYRALLNKLPGVFAAGLRLDEAGVPREIHVLASYEKNPKQLVRDVQSALLAAFDIEIDHRIVSIAQLSSDPADGERPGHGAPVRLKYKSLVSETDEERYTARVTLCYLGVDYAGACTLRNTRAQRMRAAAEATLEAVHSYYGERLYTLVAVQGTSMAGVPVSVTMLERDDGGECCTLVGAARADESGEAVGVVRATLDALNRSLGRLTPMTAN